MFVSKDIYAQLPLNTSSDSIRLLKLTRTPLGRISCQLQVHSLSRCPPFIALSYTWGAPQPTRTIQVQGQRRKIRENLWGAFINILGHWDRRYKNLKWSAGFGGVYSLPELTNIFHFLRSEAGGEEPLFWVDQICINQDNVHEKNHQVQQMKAIFSSAELTLAYLGDKGGDSDLAMDYLALSRDYVTSTTNHLPLAQLKTSTIPAPEPPYSAISALLKRSYWSRLWIVQEIVVGKRVLFMCGQKSVRWIQLAWIFDPYSTMATFDMRGNLREVYKLSEFRRQYQSTRDLTELQVLRLLEHCAMCECSDVRDRIYGVARLLQGSPLCKIPVDYSLSTKDLLRQCLLAFIYYNSKLDVLVANALIKGLEVDRKDREIAGVLGALNVVDYNTTKLCISLPALTRLNMEIGDDDFLAALGILKSLDYDTKKFKLVMSWLRRVHIDPTDEKVQGVLSLLKSTKNNFEVFELMLAKVEANGEAALKQYLSDAVTTIEPNYYREALEILESVGNDRNAFELAMARRRTKGTVPSSRTLTNGVQDDIDLSERREILESVEYNREAFELAMARQRTKGMASL